MTNSQIPDQMTAVVLDAYTGIDALRVEQRSVPKLGPNQVLVKVAATPINPSDLAFLEGNYAFKKKTPVVPGFEGSGTVVAAGSGMMGRYLLGKRVACIAGDGDGVWAEYVLTNTTLALPLASSVNMEEGAMSAVNPLTAMAFLEIAKAGRHKAIVHTAAASALGQMVNRIFKNAGIQVINVVRREEQVNMLKEIGAEIIMNSSSENFTEALEDICHQHQARLAFDAIAGMSTMQVLSAMPRHSQVMVYGGLSFEASQADPGDLIFKSKSINGFWLTSWLAKKNPLQSLVLWQRAQKLITTDLKSEVRERYPLSDAKKAIATYQNQMTGGKILLVTGE